VQVSELMSRDVVTIGLSDSCHDAAARMCRRRIRHLPVVGEGGALEGIVTDRDLRRHLFAPAVFREVGHTSVQTLLDAVPVKDVMSSPAVSVPASAALGEAARLMREHRIGALPVVEGGRLVGILTETDLLREIVREDGWCCPEVETIVVSYP
jgi:CBS domain-containing protein